MTIKIGVINQKGGVGKTTLSNALAYEIATKKKLKTLLIDFDPQASQTILMNLNPLNFLNDSEQNIATIFEKKVPNSINIVKNLNFIPANPELSKKAENAMVGKDKMLDKFMNKVADKYDVLLLDSNPSFSTLMTNIVLASDYLVIPIGTSALDEAGTYGFFQIIEDIADIYEKAPEKIFVVPTKFDKRRKDDKEVLSIIKDDLEEYVATLPNLSKSEFKVLDTVPERAVVKDAAAARMFLRDYIEKHDRNQKTMLYTIENIVEEILKGTEDKWQKQKGSQLSGKRSKK